MRCIMINAYIYFVSIRENPKQEQRLLNIGS